MCYSPIRLWQPKLGRYVDVPCGHCPDCYRKRRRQWSMRLMLESSIQVYSHFLTLTYDNDNLPRDQLGNPQFSKRDVQLFLKILRKFADPYKLRYFVVSEFGENYDRPHYHMILFGFPSDILDITKALQKSWKHGFVYVGTVTPKSINYVCKYCLALADITKVDDIMVNSDGVILTPEQRPFMLCSRNPPLGYGKLNSYQSQKFKSMIKFNKIPIMHIDGSEYGLPRTFKQKLFTPYELKKISNFVIYDKCVTMEDVHNDYQSKLHDSLTFHQRYEKTKHI